MALRMIEGFETKQVVSNRLDRLYTTSGVTPSFAFTGRKQGIAASGSNFLLTSEELVDPDENVWVIGFALLKQSLSTIGGTATAGVQIQNAGGEQVSLVMVDAGDGAYQMQLKRDTTVLATSATTFRPGNQLSWVYFQLKVTVRTGANGAYELRSYDYYGNSTVEFISGSANTAYQASDGADRVRFSWFTDGGGSIAIDDIVVMDGSGSSNNDFTTRPSVVVGALPDAEGNQLDWEPSSGSIHYDLVDDAANVSTGDTDNVTSTTIGDIDLYGYEAFGVIHTSGTSVLGLQVVSTASMAASGSRTLRVRVRSGGNEAFGSNFTVDDLTLRSTRQLFDQNPTGTPADWTKASAEAAEFGIEVQA